MKTHLTKEERELYTYIGTAEVYVEQTDRRDWLIAQGEAAGFVVTCTEAIPISFSGAAGRTYWDITFYQAGILDREETRLRKMELSKIFTEYRRQF